MIKRIKFEQAYSNGMTEEMIEELFIKNLRDNLIKEIMKQEFIFKTENKDGITVLTTDLLLLDYDDCRKLKVDTRKFEKK